LETIDRLIEERDLLTHPFYTKWVAGTLPREAIQEYARQYYAFESRFPRFLSAMHARCDDAETRQVILDNLWDEEHGEENHAELWLRFAEGIGVSRDDVRAARPSPATEGLVETYERLTSEGPVAAGVAAVHAYEAQVPKVARAKIDGLERNYGIEGGPATQFFEVHERLDVAHAGAERAVLETAAEADPEAAIEATRAALDAWWDFLDAVDPDDV
jgi:pyrroloquinoline-quinone synthase